MSVISAHSWYPDDKVQARLMPYDKVFLDLGDYFNIKNLRKHNRMKAWPPEAAREEWWDDPRNAGYQEATFEHMTKAIQDCDFSEA